MALEIKPEFAISKDATVFKVTDKTGEYSATNTGGWGSPNDDLNQVCLAFVVVRKASGGDEFLEPKTNHLVYNPLAENTKETSVEFSYLNDGAHEIYIFKIPVSGNGLTYLVGGGDIVEGDYFYYNGELRLMGPSTSEVVEASTLVELDTIENGLCEDFISARLAIQKQLLYKEYRKTREINCDDAEPLFQELLKLREDIQGATYAYYSELKIEAQDSIETLLDKYQIV